MTIFRFSESLEAISFSDFQYIQKSIASMVILYSQSIYLMKVQANASTVQKKLGARVHMLYEQWCMLQDAKQKLSKKNKKKETKTETKDKAPLTKRDELNPTPLATG